jgi:uncharacterized phage protein (TIGR01671 family)
MNNRELKFRAWDNLKKEWLKRKVYHFNPHFNEEGIGEFRLSQHPEGFTIQQYTGLKDRNGNDIYEGDLVRYSTAEYSTIAPVVFSPFGHGFVLDSSGRHGIGDSKHGGYISLISPIVSDEKITYEVIGNIFENKTNE